MMKNRKLKMHSKMIASQNILFVNAIVCCSSLFVLFLKTGIRDVSSGVIFHINSIKGRHGIVVLIN